MPPLVAPVEATISSDGLSATLPLFARDESIRAYTVIDTSDLAFVNQWVWRLSGGYAVRGNRVDGSFREYRLHRVLMGLQPEDPRVTDHIDRDRLNNRRSNLRIVTEADNGQNRSPQRGDKSPHRGVAWSEAQQKWRVRVRVRGKTYYFGHYEDEQIAAAVARDARSKLLPYATD